LHALKRTRNSLIHLLCIGILSLGGLLSCGLEAFYYIDYVPQGIYNDTNATLNLPPGSAEGYAYFDSFIIFYRIYISGVNVQTGPQLTPYDATSERIAINTTLNSDYRGLFSLTNTTSTDVNTSNLENTFYNRRYFLLTLKDADITTVLGAESLGQTLDIAFPPNPGVEPTLTVNGASYALQRAAEAPAGQTLIFTPQPNRNFLNHPDLFDTTKAYPTATNINVDVATNSGSDLRLTYVSMYIAARGTSLEMPPRTIYSQPTFIGIFSLANSG